MGRRDGAELAAAGAIWLGVAFSLGWYYTFTYYGHAGWPMPMIEPCAALVLYYFSVLNVDTEIQAVHWMLVFPAAGFLWAWALRFTAPRFGAERPPYARLALLLALGAVPMALPGPWMMWVAGQTDAGFDVNRMIAVALRRGHVLPWPGLSPMYFALGLLGLAIEVAAYARLFGRPLARAIAHYAASAVLLTVSACVLAAVAAWPLRWALE